MEVSLTLINIENLTFKYALSQTESLKGINLEIGEGEFLLLSGPSGCGKTTLLRHLKRELLPEGEKSGRVLYLGQDIESIEPSRSACDIGLVMQNPDSQIVTDVVWHELAFGLEDLGVPGSVIRRRVAEMASFFGIGSWFHKKTSELSGGQKQLLNLASVLAMQPRLLLLDEPTAQLDPITAREFIGMVSRLNRELGITVVMSEHRLEEVMPVCSRAVLMENGRIKYNMAPQKLPAALEKGGDTGYLHALPAAAQIFAKLSLEEHLPCPLTVRAGKEMLTKLLGKKSPAKNAKKAEVLKQKSTKPRDAVISCREVFFKYDKDSPDVLSGLSLDAFAGEFLCLVGENGCGKSTLLQLLAGVFRPQRGKVTVDGRDIRSFSPKQLYFGNIALLPQNPKSVFLRDTLKEELGENGIKTAVSLGLGGLLTRHPYDLSGGEQQKAALARVLLQKPRILLLDEPTKGLDAEAKEELAGIFKNLCCGGALIIASTHDIEFAAKYAGRCALLFDGTIASEGDARKFFGGNYFYTTAANRIARDFAPDAITSEDVKKLCGI